MMKDWRLHSILVVCLLFLVMLAKAAVVPASGDGKRVILINSYDERIVWSKNIADSLESMIRRQHPDWMVYSRDLKTGSATYASAAALTLRSILWGYAERTRTDVDATSLAANTIFVQDDIPDAIVWIGEEEFMLYLVYRYVLGKWKHVPMVLCAVKDSLSADKWFPEKGFNFEHKERLRDREMLEQIFMADDPALEVMRRDKEVRFTKVQFEGKDAYRVGVDLDYCANIVYLPVRRNLELIHSMLPDLQELIWVDENSYRSTEARLEVEKELKRIMPEVKYSTMIHNRMNGDSIYDVMLEPARNRAFLTYSWNIDAVNSRRSDKKIDSLFTSVATVPLFTLTERDFSKDNYWIGGYYLRYSQAVKSAYDLLECAVRGDSVMKIPFDTLSEAGIVLNRTALERYGLVGMAEKLGEEVTYVHIPPTFFQKYERQLLVSFLVLMAVICYVVFNLRRSRYNKRIKKDYDRYKRLYNKLQVIYANSSIDFALYGEDGKRLLRIVNGKVDSVEEGSDLFHENIFESPCLSSDLKEQIRFRHSINCEVSLDYSGRLSRTSFAEHAVYQLIVKPLHEVSYQNSCFMAIAINLTPTIRERQEKERFEELFRFASDSSRVGVAFYDGKTAVGMASDSWCRNMNEKFVSGEFPVYGQVVEEDRTALLEYQQAMCAGEIRDVFCRDIRVNGEDGKSHWVRQHMYRIYSSGRLIELSLNIDEQKANEKKLEEAKHQAEEANEETCGFLSSISHEVRTPLNSIVGFSTILAVLDDEETVREYIPIIQKNSRLLDTLINNILDLSALDGGKVLFDYKQVDIADIFADMEVYIRNNLYNHPLRVIRELPECEGERIITTDEEHLRMLLLNLLSNAVKFTDRGSITLGCRRQEQEFYFYVADTGCGIGKDEQKYIFNRFVKLDTYIQGTGLGLSLCKSIVKHLGGEIGVISEKDKGSTFWFTLPYKQ